MKALPLHNLAPEGHQGKENSYELIFTCRIHRFTMWAAPVIFATVALSVPIGMTTAWHTFAAFLNRIIGSHIS